MVDYSNIPRDSRRVPLETRVQYKFDRFSGFLSEYSANVSPGGIYLRTRAPQPPGTVMDFEFRLGDGFELIKGRGEVVWTRSEDEGPTRPAGMGIRFLELSPGSKELIYRIVDQHILQGGTPFDVTQRPPDIPPVTPPMSAGSAGAAGAAADSMASRRTPPPPREPVASPERPPAGDVFNLPPAPAAAAVPRWEPEPPPADSWLPTPEDPVFDPRQPVRSSEPFPDLLTPPEPEPAPMSTTAPAPMFATTFGAASARPQRRVLPLVLLVAGIVLAAGLFLLRDRLMGWLGIGGEEEVVQTAPPVRPRRTEPPASAPAGSPATSEPTPLVEEMTGTPSPTPEPSPAEPSSSPATLPQTAPAAPPQRELREPMPAVAEPAPDAGPALTGLERITWEEAAGGTDVILWGNGAFPSESYKRTRIDGNPPRELFRLSGIRKPFSKTRLAAGSAELLQVRVGYHPEMGRGELHVVLDLSRPNVVVTGVEPGEHRLRIHLQRR